MHIKVGTRSSKLALWQSNHVISVLEKAYPMHTYEIVEIKTKGDKIQNVSLQKIGDKGLFVKEIEEQLLAGSIDMAVHSMKDMPSKLPEGLCFAKAWEREDVRDVLVLQAGCAVSDLKEKAIIGTGSLRRIAQIKQLRSEAVIKDIRGNVDTRLKKLDDGEYDAIIMAAAGLKRLGLEKRISYYFEPEEMIPASAQGTLAIEVREDQKELLTMLNAVSDEETHHCVQAERAFLASMDGNCHVPVGAYCVKQEAGYALHAIFGFDEEHTATYHGVGSDTMKLVQEAVMVMKKEVEKGNG